MLPHLVSQPRLRCREREDFGEKGAAKSWCGNWVIWSANRMGDLRRKARSQLTCTVALGSLVECSPKGGAEDSGRPLLGRQYPVRLSRTYAGMKVVEHDARTLRVSWVAGGAMNLDGK